MKILSKFLINILSFECSDHNVSKFLEFGKSIGIETLFLTSIINNDDPVISDTGNVLLNFVGRSATNIQQLFEFSICAKFKGEITKLKEFEFAISFKLQQMLDSISDKHRVTTFSFVIESNYISSFFIENIPIQIELTDFEKDILGFYPIALNCSEELITRDDYTETLEISTTKLNKNLKLQEKFKDLQFFLVVDGNNKSERLQLLGLNIVQDVVNSAHKIELIEPINFDDSTLAINFRCCPLPKEFIKFLAQFPYDTVKIQFRENSENGTCRLCLKTFTACFEQFEIVKSSIVLGLEYFCHYFEIEFLGNLKPQEYCIVNLQEIKKAINLVHTENDLVTLKIDKGFLTFSQNSKILAKVYISELYNLDDNSYSRGKDVLLSELKSIINFKSDFNGVVRIGFYPFDWLYDQFLQIDFISQFNEIRTTHYILRQIF